MNAPLLGRSRYWCVNAKAVKRTEMGLHKGGAGHGGKSGYKYTNNERDYRGGEKHFLHKYLCYPFCVQTKIAGGATQHIVHNILFIYPYCPFTGNSSPLSTGSNLLHMDVKCTYTCSRNKGYLNQKGRGSMTETLTRQTQLTAALTTLHLPPGIHLRSWTERDFPAIERLSTAQGWTTPHNRVDESPFHFIFPKNPFHRVYT